MSTLIGDDGMSLISEVKEGLARLDDSVHELKKFGFTLAVALAALSTLLFIFGSHPYRALWTGFFAIAFAVIALLFPRTLGPLRLFWMGLAFVLGYFMSRLILTLVFFLVITGIRIIMTILGKDILKRSLKKQTESYWLRRKCEQKDPNDFEKMF